MIRPQPSQTLRQTQKLFSTSSFTSSSLSILGGDYAGQSANFSCIDGKLIPVPEHYVPESMVEWGQVPSCLEIIVSEDLHTGATASTENTSASTSTTASFSNHHILERTTVTVMPEVGCGLDNLDTIKKKDEVPIGLYHTYEMDHVKVSTAFVEESKSYIECIFAQEMELNEEKRQGDNDNDNDNTEKRMRRTRVRVNLQDSSNELKSPIEIIREHKTGEKSSHGTIADGGGLDARTVTQLVGTKNISKPFCDEKASTVESLEGNWKAVLTGTGTSTGTGTDSSTSDDAAGKQSLFQFGADHWNSDDSTTLNLPGGVHIRHCLSPRTIEVCLLLESQDGLPMKRIVVKHDLDGHGAEVICYSEEKVE